MLLRSMKVWTLDYRNRDFHRKMTQGVSVTWKDAKGNEQARHIYPINYREPEKNKFICADEVTIIGKNTRRTDLLIFINGIPVIVFEFKNMFDKEVGVENAHRQIGHYILDIPQLFDYNAITIVSDGMEALHGMYNSSLKWFCSLEEHSGRRHGAAKRVAARNSTKRFVPERNALKLPAELHLSRRP